MPVKCSMAIYYGISKCEQGHRKENLTYTAMVKRLKPYRLMQKLKDYKGENIVCRVHMHAKHASTRGFGHDPLENFKQF